MNVRGIVVVDENGYRYLRREVDSGQTALVTFLPLGQRVTVATVHNLARTVGVVTLSTEP